MPSIGAVRRLLLVVALFTFAPAEGHQRAVGLRDPAPPPRDQFSAAEPHAAVSTHLDLDLEVDFEARRLRGSVTHTIVNLIGTTRFIVDTRNLHVTDVTIDGEQAQWSFGTGSAIIGRPLIVQIGPGTRRVRIEYQTSPQSSALFWQEASQTFGGVAPFLFTLVQPDRTREWIPLQDTPGVRTTYNATLRVPPGLLALMSARNATEAAPDGLYEIEMPYPIPSYLIALAVGRLEFHPLDERTGIYCEPEIAADALWDLQYVPEMVDVAERLMGPYPFERYDVLLAPPGFYAGGMENPMLNFLNTYSVVPGNGESPPAPHDTMAHELAHSWAGDLLTCGTWSDTWLNEGFATYYAKRILEEMSGAERAEIGLYWDRLNYESYTLNYPDAPSMTTLHREFLPTEKPSIFNPTNYSKGSIFLKTLEDAIGRERFDTIIRAWFARYRFRWVDERAFIDHLAHWNVDADAVLLDEWIYGSGLPANVSAPTSSTLWERIGVQSARFEAGVAASDLDTTGWRHLEQVLFFWQLSESSVTSRMAELDAAFGFSRMKTPPMHWLLAVAVTRYAPALTMFERYVVRGGPNVIAIYQRLAQTAEGRAYALELYERARPRYDNNTRSHVDRILGVSSARLPAAA